MPRCETLIAIKTKAILATGCIELKQRAFTRRACIYAATIRFEVAVMISCTSLDADGVSTLGPIWEAPVVGLAWMAGRMVVGRDHFHSLLSFSSWHRASPMASCNVASWNIRTSWPISSWSPWTKCPLTHDRTTHVLCSPIVQNGFGSSAQIQNLGEVLLVFHLYSHNQ